MGKSRKNFPISGEVNLKKRQDTKTRTKTKQILRDFVKNNLDEQDLLILDDSDHGLYDYEDDYEDDLVD